MKRTPLFKFHKEHGRLGEYAGYEMPLWYKGTLIEHINTRNNVGIFDVSHMGRLFIKGSQALELLNRLSTNNYSQTEILQAQHAFFCNSYGGIIDDILVFRLAQDEFLIVVNAMNREKDLEWINRNKGSLDVTLMDLTEKVPMIAVQGPKSSQTCEVHGFILMATAF